MSPRIELMANKFKSNTNIAQVKNLKRAQDLRKFVEKI